MPDRVIYHIDCNAYFASVEEALYPKLRAAPMAICNHPGGQRGVILAKNELARRRGVQTAESVFRALEKCPELVLRPARRDKYREYCERINNIYIQYSDLVERANIDESYLDVTHTLHLFGGDAIQLAHQIRERVHRELDLTVSVGVSFNKVFAKIGSDMKKPNAVTAIGRETYRDLLWPLPVSTLPMVGRANEAALRRIGLRTVGDLAGADRAMLARMGRVFEQLHSFANGEDLSPVRSADAPEEVKSVGSGRTFERDLSDRAEIHARLASLADEVASGLRRKKLKCMAVQVTVKDPSFKIITRQRQLGRPSWLAADLSAAAVDLVEAAWPAGKPVRMLTVTALKLLPEAEAAEQLSLFGDPKEARGRARREQLELAMDRIRGKYGSESISTAGDLGLRAGREDDGQGGDD